MSAACCGRRACSTLRRRFARGEIDQAALTAAEDRAIEDAIALQAARRPAARDRRRVPPRLVSRLFLRPARRHLVRSARTARPAARGAQPVASIKQPHRLERPDPRRRISRSCARARKALPKITIPGPCALHFRGGDAAVTAHAYRDVEEFWDDIVAAFQSELRALAAAGCTLRADRRDRVRQVRRSRRAARRCARAATTRTR